MTTIGIIDIGTNTILCIKASAEGTRFNIIRDQRYHYRAGNRLDETGNISSEYKVNLRQALLEAVSLIKDCDKIKIVATEVFRRPKDGNKYAHNLSIDIGFPIEVIDHQREAQLSFSGATAGFANLSGRIGVIDIGGGSTELAIGENQKLISWSGLKIGAVAINEAVGYGAPLDNYLISAEDTFRHSNFLDLLMPIPHEIIIVGGTAVAIAGLMAQIHEFLPEKIQGTKIAAPGFHKLLIQLAAMNIGQRKTLMAFDPQRADIIISGGAIMLAFMRFAGVDLLTVSTRGLRFGLLNELASSASS
jgi:exopolyphosphatase / guanosine-5'-triphosphate,3'-diphosphate pyrophosphatase